MDCSKCCKPDAMLLVGRVMMSLMFIIAGFSKIMTFDITHASMLAEGIPYTNVLLVLAIIVELGGGLMLLFGWKARFGALLLFLFIIPVTYYHHDFWLFDGEQATQHVYHFLKNLTIMGGLLCFIAAGPGKCSIDKK